MCKSPEMFFWRRNFSASDRDRVYHLLPYTMVVFSCKMFLKVIILRSLFWQAYVMFGGGCLRRTLLTSIFIVVMLSSSHHLPRKHPLDLEFPLCAVQPIPCRCLYSKISNKRESREEHANELFPTEIKIRNK